MTSVIVGLLSFSALYICAAASLGFECEQFTARPSTQSSAFTHHIKSPSFPLPRPPGNYVCEYIFNPKKHSVRILFTDFFLYGSSVQESLMTNCLHGDGDYIEISVNEEIVETYCAASKSRPPPLSVTEKKLTIRYVVRANTTSTTRPGFQATYVFTKDSSWLEKPKVMSEYILSNGDGHSSTSLNRPGVYDVMLLIQSSNLVFFNFNATTNISISDIKVEIILYDGSASASLASHRQGNLNAFDYTSLQTTLLVKIKIELSLYQAVDLLFVYAFCTLSKSVGGFCPLDYYPCQDSFHCIPNKLLCDSYYHCPDRSDEIYCDEPCLNCRNGGVCDQSTNECHCFNNFYGSQCHFYACGEVNCNQGVCKIADPEGSYMCVCHMGYTGKLCDTQEVGTLDPCPCERKNRCHVYVSLSMGVICMCEGNFYGPNCEFEGNSYVDYEAPPELPDEYWPTYPEVHGTPRTISKLWIILLTAFGILFVIMFCCCIAKRGSPRASRSTREHCPHNSTNRVNTRNDCTQMQSQASSLMRSSSSLFAMIAAWRRATRPPTPPPSYDAIAPMYCQVATDIAMTERSVYACRPGHHPDAVYGTITRESSGLPDVVTDGEMRLHIGQSIVSQV
ncbi:uncharacterized protein [Antedon mediterranea]|uniref:uncharacterized protein n=1 Tax=Antedon mediterranea TaxID=105859 RepID=UPI003AF5536A